MSAASQRSVALDVFRGMAIAGMILVNTPGAWAHIYTPLQHAKWHGCTPTDLVFPFFLFATGAAMFFSFAKNEYRPNPGVLRSIARRSALLFVIGALCAHGFRGRGANQGLAGPLAHETRGIGGKIFNHTLPARLCATDRCSAQKTLCGLA